MTHALCTLLGLALGLWLRRPRVKPPVYAPVRLLPMTPIGEPIAWADDGRPANPADYKRRMAFGKNGDVVAEG